LSIKYSLVSPQIGHVRFFLNNFKSGSGFHSGWQIAFREGVNMAASDAAVFPEVISYSMFGVYGVVWRFDAHTWQAGTQLIKCAAF
jgi:hypothetical protein